MLSCKIRVLETEEETITLVRNLCDAGAQAIAVHARRTGEREANRATDRWGEIRAIVAALGESHPEVVVSVNGDVFDAPLDVERARKESGASGVMIARAAMENASIFAAAKAGSASALVSRAKFFRQYLIRSMETGNNWKNSKYVVQQALRQRSALSRPEVGVVGAAARCCFVSRTSSLSLSLSLSLSNSRKLIPRTATTTAAGADQVLLPREGVTANDLKIAMTANARANRAIARSTSMAVLFDAAVAEYDGTVAGSEKSGGSGGEKKGAAKKEETQKGSGGACRTEEEGEGEGEGEGVQLVRRTARRLLVDAKRRLAAAREGEAVEAAEGKGRADGEEESTDGLLPPTAEDAEKALIGHFQGLSSHLYSQEYLARQDEELRLAAERAAHRKKSIEGRRKKGMNKNKNKSGGIKLGPKEKREPPAKRQRVGEKCA